MDYECDCRPLVERLNAEHRHLGEQLRQMQAAIDGGIRSRSDADAIAQRLFALRDELDRHFAEEERGGCLEEAVSRCPSLSRDVSRVIAEHNDLRADVDRIVGQARLLADAPAVLAQLQPSFAEFATRLRAHDALESRILVYGFGAGALDELTEDPSGVDAGPCGCGAQSGQGSPQVNKE